MKKQFTFLFITMICLIALFSSCGNAEEERLTATRTNTRNANEFMDYGDFSDYIDENTDIHTWRTLCKESFPDMSTYQSDSIDPNKPMIALTFDDGPNDHTDRLLNIFKTHGGKGTFFVVGNTVDKKQDTLKRMANEGHEIGNHSWSHTQLTNLDEKALVAEVMRTREKVYELTGNNSLIVRPPYGSYNDTLKSVGEKVGVCYINWSVDSLDWKSKNVQAIYTEIFSHVNNGAIILCHDLHKTTVDAMEQVVPELIRQGYQLVTISELLSYSKTPAKAGNIYYRQ